MAFSLRLLSVGIPEYLGFIPEIPGVSEKNAMLTLPGVSRHIPRVSGPILNLTAIFWGPEYPGLRPEFPDPNSQRLVFGLQPI